MQVVTYAERRLVKRHRGTMPVLLTSPHGGSETPPGVSERTKAATPGGCSFKTARDNETALITESLAQKLLDLTGVSPYVVLARFHRRFIDANRESACAFIDSDARPFYDEYHHNIEGYVNQILEQNGGCGFLFDIHGTLEIEDDPADVYLGTANGLALRPDFDRGNLFMQHGLQGLLKSARRSSGVGAPETIFSYRVSPADETRTETSEVSGGFTVRHYGASITSIQIEIANTIRNDEAKRGFFIDDLALAIVNFVRRHAPF
jgi:N-formylglutamate amidohydrolase